MGTTDVVTTFFICIIVNSSGIRFGEVINDYKINHKNPVKNILLIRKKKKRVRNGSSR